MQPTRIHKEYTIKEQKLNLRYSQLIFVFIPPPHWLLMPIDINLKKRIEILVSVDNRNKPHLLILHFSQVISMHCAPVM